MTYWTDSAIDAAFEQRARPREYDFDAATMDRISQNQGLLQIRQNVLQTSLRRAWWSAGRH